MLRTPALLALALSITGSGCATEVADTDDSEPDLVSQSHAALSTSSSPKKSVQLYARATFDPNLGVTIVDVATSSLVPIGDIPVTDPHTADVFTTAMVYVEREGRRDILRVMGKHQIGPGGGCIHFNVPAAIGDRLFIGGVVQLAGSKASTVGIAWPVVVTNGDWQNDPTVNMHPGGSPTP